MLFHPDQTKAKQSTKMNHEHTVMNRNEHTVTQVYSSIPSIFSNCSPSVICPIFIFFMPSKSQSWNTLAQPILAVCQLLPALSPGFGSVSLLQSFLPKLWSSEMKDLDTDTRFCASFGHPFQSNSVSSNSVSSFSHLSAQRRYKPNSHSPTSAIAHWS